MAEWFTVSWFRITEKRVDRANKNQSRAGVAKFWQQVQAKFANWTGTALARVPKISIAVPDFKALKQQAVGCVASITAHVTDAEFMQQWNEIGLEFAAEANVSIAAKRMELEARYRVVDDAGIPF